MTHEDSAEHGGPAPDIPPSGAPAAPGATTPIPAAPHPDAATAQLHEPTESPTPPSPWPAPPEPVGAAPIPPPPAAANTTAESSGSARGISRRARLGARWRHSLPLRIATAVVVALLIGGIGFAAGTAFSGGDGGHHAHHDVNANHPFWQNHEGWIHRGEHLRHRLRLTPAAPSANPAPASVPAHPN